MTASPERSLVDRYAGAAPPLEGPLVSIYDPVGPLGILSNFALTPFVLDGEVWPSTEHAFQAAKFTDTQLRENVRAAPTGAGAKALAWSEEMTGRVRPDWDRVRLTTMEQVLRAKFAESPVARCALTATWPMCLIEGSPTDEFWGVGPDGAGQNQLGRLLEAIRHDLVGLPTPLDRTRGTLPGFGGASRFIWGPIRRCADTVIPHRALPAIVYDGFSRFDVAALLDAGPEPAAQAGDRSQWSDALQKRCSTAFDLKYGRYTWHQDARAAVHDWTSRFVAAWARRIGMRLDAVRVLAVGAGSANEAANVWEAFGPRATLVDVGDQLVRNCAAEAPQATVHKGRAEALRFCRDGSIDLYCAMRTYESRFFGVTAALAEAARVLRSGGILLVSVSNGYLTKAGTIAHGQIGVDGLLDPFLPWHHLLEIAAAARAAGFEDFEFVDLESEVAFTANRSGRALASEPARAPRNFEAR